MIPKPLYKITKPSTEKDEIISMLEDGKVLGWNSACDAFEPYCAELEALLDRANELVRCYSYEDGDVRSQWLADYKAVRGEKNGSARL